MRLITNFIQKWRHYIASISTSMMHFQSLKLQFLAETFHCWKWKSDGFEGSVENFINYLHSRPFLFLCITHFQSTNLCWITRFCKCKIYYFKVYKTFEQENRSLIEIVLSALSKLHYSLSFLEILKDFVEETYVLMEKAVWSMTN